jgi:hypothetical protein
MQIAHFALAALAIPVLGAELPIVNDFNDQISGLPPALGGPNQPDAIEGPSNQVTVQNSALGLTDKPILMTQSGGFYQGLSYSFDPITSQSEDPTLRVEATISVDSGIFIGGGFGIQASTALPNGAVINRLQITGDNLLYTIGGAQVPGPAYLLGTWQPGVPFRIRYDIDMSIYRYYVTLDNEMNGFDDDPVSPPLYFANPDHAIDQLSAVILANGFTATNMAYDDIYIGPIPAPPLPCPEDLDGDEAIGSTDLNILLAAFGVSDEGDIDGDGETTSADLNLLLAAFGDGCNT